MRNQEHHHHLRSYGEAAVRADGPFLTIHPARAKRERKLLHAVVVTTVERSVMMKAICVWLAQQEERRTALKGELH